MKYKGKSSIKSQFLSSFTETSEQVVLGQCPCPEDLLLVLPQWFEIRKSGAGNHSGRRGYLEAQTYTGWWGGRLEWVSQVESDLGCHRKDRTEGHN